MPLSPAAVKAHARDLGFDLCGIARGEKHPKLGRLAEWIARGYAGDMSYLTRTLDERLDPARVLPSVRSVVSLACIYNVDRPYSTSVTDPGRVSVSRYAWGDDYHDALRMRLRALVDWMAETAGRGFEAFSSVDTAPVQERVFAEQAGLGWIGKNTCVINADAGSWMFLAQVFTNAVLEADAPAIDQCGTCVRCLEACPTGALVEPYALDATRCLSYVTIESRETVSTEMRAAIDRQVYGCDICQDVCPWNRRAATSDDPAWHPREGLAFPTLIDLCRLSDDAWRALLKGSAMRRAGLKRVRRSLAYAAAHLAHADAAVALDALEAHPSSAEPQVADALSWSRETLGAGRP